MAFGLWTLSFELLIEKITMSVQLGRALLVIVAPDVVLEARLRLLDGLLVGLEGAVVVVIGEPIFMLETLE